VDLEARNPRRHNRHLRQEVAALETFSAAMCCRDEPFRSGRGSHRRSLPECHYRTLLDKLRGLGLNRVRASTSRTAATSARDGRSEARPISIRAVEAELAWRQHAQTDGGVQ
jgi:hypothetical protein